MPQPSRTLSALSVALCCPLALAAGAETPNFYSGASTGIVSVPGLVEASGLAASRTNPGVFWTHNDKGGLPRIFAIDSAGRWLGTYSLGGATHIDYEDIAAFGDQLYLGDIGDKKNGERPSIQVYRIVEPTVDLSQATSPPSTTLTNIETLSLRYADGPRNAEALMVDPLTGDLFIIAKFDAVARVYRAAAEDLQSGPAITLTHEATLAFDNANGADISIDGSLIVVRQESFAKLWQRAPNQTVVEALAGTPIVIPVVGKPTEKNGEAIAFDAFGAHYHTLSDSLPTQPFYKFTRTNLPPPEIRSVEMVGSGAMLAGLRCWGEPLVVERCDDLVTWEAVSSHQPTSATETIALPTGPTPSLFRIRRP